MHALMHAFFFCVISSGASSLFGSRKKRNQAVCDGLEFKTVCGERGIRTPGPVARTTVFETAPIDHSGISPECHTRRGVTGANIITFYCKPQWIFSLRWELSLWL